MDGSYTRGSRGRGHANHDTGSSRGRPHSRNKHWSAGDSGSARSTPNHSDSERWERGGHRGGGRGRGGQSIFPNVSIRLNNSPSRSPQPKRAPVARQPDPQPETFDDVEFDDVQDGEHGEEYHTEVENVEPQAEGQLFPEIHEPELDSPEEREKFYQELVKGREQERKTAIAEGKMDDPLVPKRLEDAISIVGTCMDMCPRFERYRRVRENNLFEWEMIPGTKRIDHNRAVKMYERAAGDKTLPSDLRPPHVLKRTLDYLFRDLLPRGGFSATFNFIRDRSRAVRNDFTMQHITGPLAIECHDRCARFHILALHFERDRPGFSIPLEEQQLMNTLQSLKEFYEDQRGRYESPSELEMRVYHRLIHIRDQKERHEDIPDYITSHPVFKLTTAFRLHVQEKSAPISKTSKLVVTDEGMQIFSQLAMVLSEQGSTVMVYLVACLLERLFGKDTIDDIEAIRRGLSIPDIIDGVSSERQIEEVHESHNAVQSGEAAGEDQNGEEEEYYDDGDDEEGEEYYEDGGYEAESEQAPASQPTGPISFKPTQAISAPPPSQTSSSTPAVPSAFAGLVAKPNPFVGQSIFGGSPFAPASGAASSVFGNLSNQAPPATATQPAPAPTVPQPQQGLTSVSPFAPGGSVAPAFSVSTTPQTTNFFNTQPISNTIPAAPAVQIPEPQSKSSAPLFGGIHGSLFSNTSSTTSAGSWSHLRSSEPSSTAPPSLNPKAPEFAPTTKSSIFPQPFSFPTNGTSKEPIPQPTAAPALTSHRATAPETRPLVNGAMLFSINPTSTTAQPSFFSKPSPPTAKSVTPPLNRPVAPPLLKINTNTSSSSSGSSTIASPAIPPLMPKKQPISLPSTPTTVLQPQSALLGHLRNTLEGSGSGSGYFGPQTSGSQDMLSPLVMGSPTTSAPKPFHNFTPLSTPKALKRFRMSSPPPSPSTRKGKSPERPVSDVEQMKKKALGFAQRGVIVRQAFRQWMQRAIDKAAYLEARKRDEEYREKLHRSRGSAGVGPLAFTSTQGVNGNGRAVDKRRRVSTNGVATGENGPSPMKKRARKRMSGEYRAPRTDEELAKRFKENHEEHELRWAKGSFLQVIRKHVGKLNAATLKMPWNVWLSMNPESDATAIWLERKFDVPDSGSWVSEAAFSIPLSSAAGPGGAGYPGLIVFETTPLAEISDELERKYRILDDCSRLREIHKSLSPRRHFIPSLLVISWDEQDQTLTSDFFTMVKKLVADSIIQNFQVFAITSATKDLDNRLDGVLNTLTLDTEGKLVQILSIDGVFKLYELAFDSFVAEWMESCTINGRFNWTLYTQLVQASIVLLNVVSNSVQSLLELSGPRDPLPGFDYDNISDSESCYDSANEWLSKLTSRDESKMIAGDMHSHRNIGQEFPGRVFIDHLAELVKARFERLYPRVKNTESAILKSSINTSLESFKRDIRPHALKLSQTYNFSARRSPKRRANSMTISELGSPEAKRPRLVASVASTDGEHDTDGIRTVPSTPQMNGNRQMQTPSPTGSTVSAAATDHTIEREGPTFTVAMLRALTRDLKKKYAVGCS